MNKQDLATLHKVKQAIRDKYAWPRGYPLYVVMTDGESLSIDAARENWREVCRAVIFGWNRGTWFPACVEINWEDPDLYCVHSGARIDAFWRAH